MHRDLNMWGLALLLLCLNLPARAQEQEGPILEALPAADVERLYLNPGRGSLLVGSGELLLKGEYRVALGVHYQRMPLRMNTAERQLSLIGHRATAMVAGAYGVLPWLEVALQVPIVINQGGDDPAAQGLLSPTARGLGTPMAHARMGILSQRDGYLSDFSVDLGLGLPLGSGSALAREPWPRLQAHALLGRHMGPVRVALDGGLLLRVPSALGPRNLTRSSLGQELRLGAAVGTTREGLQVEAAMRSALALETGLVSTEVLAGLRYPLYSWLEIFSMGGMGVGSLPGTPGFRLLVGVAGGPPPAPIKPTIPRGVRSAEPLLVGSDDSEKPKPLAAPPSPDNES